MNGTYIMTIALCDTSSNQFRGTSLVKTLAAIFEKDVNDFFTKYSNERM